MEGIFKVQAKERQKGGQGGVLLTQKSEEANEDRNRRAVDSRIGDLAGTGRSKVEAVKKIRKTVALPGPRSAAPRPEGKGGPAQSG